MPAAAKGFSQRTISDVTKNKELFPSTAVTSQGPNERFRVSLGWSSLLLDSVTVCHLPKKAQLASYQCTNAEDKEVSALWIHFQQRRSYVVWGFQWLRYQTDATALLSGFPVHQKYCQDRLEQGASRASPSVAHSFG